MMISTPGVVTIAEGDAEIDHDPLARMRRTVAVKVEVHPDLVRAAERQEDELIALVGSGGAGMRCLVMGLRT